MKTCTKCDITKEFAAFSPIVRYGKPSYYPQCKLCKNQATNEYKKNNPEKVKENSKKQNKQNYANLTDEQRAKKNEKAKEYYYRHQERINRAHLDYYHENKKTLNPRRYELMMSDPQRRLAQTLRDRFIKAIRNGAKKGSAVSDLGMSIAAFLVYLNLGALDKYGTPYTGFEHLYDIDHIKPLASFDLTDRMQLLKAVHWSNLQVLTKTENRRKGAKV